MSLFCCCCCMHICVCVCVNVRMCIYICRCCTIFPQPLEPEFHTSNFKIEKLFLKIFHLNFIISLFIAFPHFHTFSTKTIICNIFHQKLTSSTTTTTTLFEIRKGLHFHGPHIHTNSLIRNSPTKNKNEPLPKKKHIIPS